MALTKIQTAGITDDAVTAAAIADGTVVAAEIGADAVGASELADDSVASANIIDGAIVNVDINASAAIALSKLSTSGSASSSTFLRGDGAWSSVDLASVRNDIATLALHSAITDNKAAYNLSNAFIDQFEDDSGLDNQTNVDRVGDPEYMSSVTSTTEAYHVNANGYASSTGGSGGP